MTRQDIKKLITKLPDAPGVYFFRRGKGSHGEILYIGKATSLRDRVRSYFSADIAETRSPLIAKMLGEFDDISFQQTDSVLEALILEANLIKKHQPPANIKEKDNRSWNFVVITDEKFPRVLIVRGRELEQENFPEERPGGHRSHLGEQMAKGTFDTEIKHKFGPFPNGAQLKEAMKIVRRLFPFRDKCQPYVGLRAEKEKVKPCFNRQIGLCPGVCTGEILEKEYKKTIKNIVLFFESDKKQLVKNLQKEMKKLANQRKFEEADKIKKTIFTLNHIQDVALIKESKGPTFANQIPQGRTLGTGMSRVSLDTNFRIESYDIAHMSGQNMVGVMIVVEDGEAKKSDYRKFKIRGNVGNGTNGQSQKVAKGSAERAGNIGTGTANDTKALAEILTRRLAHIEWLMADLIVVDGGVAQKNVMEKVLRENRLQIPVVSVVKDERHKPKQILGDLSAIARQIGKKYSDIEREILLSNSEAHRFAISFHIKLRDKLPK